MKNEIIKKSAIVCSRVLFLFTICEIIILWLNRKLSEPWNLLWYDLQSGFSDNKEYLNKFLFAFIIFLICYFFYLANNKDGFSFVWHIRIGKRRGFVWKSHWVILGCISAAFLGVTSMIYQGMISCGRSNLWEGSILVGHSFGRVDEYTYTGCLEAFLVNYEKGYRTFEVDLTVTGDKKVVLRHDWEQAIQEGISSDNIPTQDQFLSIPICGMYTPLSFQDLCLLMKEYPDIWIVTDSKYTDTEDVKEQFAIMVQTAKECDAEDVLDRLIIQIYNPEMHDAVKEVYPFKSFIFTLYQYWDGSIEQFTEICRWSVKHNVDVITMHFDYAIEENLEVAKRYDRDIYVHTVDDAEVAKEFLDKGVRGIYTDDISPEELKEERK